MTVSRSDPNVIRLARTARKLAPLLDRLVFVGGCVTGLLLSDPAVAPARPTLDVDATIEIASYGDFRLLEELLAELGFRRNRAELICRWFAEELIFDLIPTDPSILGFSNRWYRPGLENAQTARIEEIEIRHITAVYFLATKLEAFHSRGKDDYRTSHDLEDIVTVIDGRIELVKEIADSSTDLRQYLRAEFRALLATPEFRDALPGHLLPDAASQQRISIVLKRIQRIIDGS